MSHINPDNVILTPSGDLEVGGASSGPAAFPARPPTKTSGTQLPHPQSSLHDPYDDWASRWASGLGNP